MMSWVIVGYISGQTLEKCFRICDYFFEAQGKVNEFMCKLLVIDMKVSSTCDMLKMKTYLVEKF